MSFELKTDFKGVKEYQTYPDVFDFNYIEKCDIPEEFAGTLENQLVPTSQPTVDPTSQPTVDPTSQPTVDPTAQPTSQPTIPPQSIMKRGESIQGNVVGITLGLLVSIFFIFYALYLTSDEARSSSDYAKYIVLFLTCVIMCLVITIFILTYKRIDKAENAFNCNVLINTNIPLNTINNLNLDPSILKRLNITNDASICQDIYNLDKGYRVSSIPDNLCQMNYTNYQNYMGIMKTIISIPIIIILIVIYGTFIKEDFFEFVTSPKIKVSLIILSIIIMIGLISSLYMDISSNKLAFHCNDLGSFRNRLNSVAITDNRIMTAEENAIHTKLEKLNLNDNALICNDKEKTLVPFEKSSNAFNGLLLFVYIIMSVMLIFFTILLIIQSELDTSIFNLGSDVGKKIGYLFLTLLVTIITFVSIIYPWSLSTNNEKATLITGLTSSLIPTTIIIFSTILGTLIGE